MIQFIILGLGVGALYALVAQGVVLVYRASGILNFASGAIGMVGAELFFELRDNDHWPMAFAMVLGIGVAALIGVLTHFLIMRRLRNASGIARLVATLALFTFLTSGAELIWGYNLSLVPSVLPATAVHVSGKTSVPLYNLILLAAAIALTIALTIAYRYTRFGLATSATSENERATASLGFSPDLISAVNWAVGSALAGACAILVTPIIGLQVSQLSLLIIPALAAALLGSFTSLPMSLAGGLLIGVAESLAGRYVMSVPGLSDAIPFALIVLTLVFRGKALPVRGDRADRGVELGTGRLRPVALIAVFAVSCLVLLSGSINLTVALSLTLLGGFAILSITVVTGYAGQLSLAQWGIFGLGSWVAAEAVSTFHVPYELGIVAAVVGGLVVGVIVGLPAVRVRGVNLAIVTLALALAVNALIFNSPQLGGELLGGLTVGSAKLFGFDVNSITNVHGFAIAALITFTLTALVVRNLRRSQTGRQLAAVGSNERAAAALGINLAAKKLYAFAIASGIAALGGALAAYQYPIASFSNYDAPTSISFVLYAALGGIGMIPGAVVGGTFVPGGLGSLIQTSLFSGSAVGWVTAIAAFLTILIIIMSPGGLAHLHTRQLQAAELRLRGIFRWASARSDVVAAPPPPGEPAISKEAGHELVVTGLTVRFGAVTAVKDVSLTVRPGEIVGLIGPNGAGKSTLIDAVTGVVKSASGSVRIDDQVIDGWPAYRRARAGIGRSFQSLELFERMSIRDNLAVSRGSEKRFASVLDLVHPSQPVPTPASESAVRRFDLRDDLDRMPHELAYGRRRLVAIARAVAAGPSVLLLDEPAAGLDSAEGGELGLLIRELAHDRGLAILLVEHNVPLVLDVCDRVVVLNFGEVIAAGSPEQIRRNPAVVEAYLGESAGINTETQVSVAPEPEAIS